MKWRLNPPENDPLKKDYIARFWQARVGEHNGERIFAEIYQYDPKQLNNGQIFPLNTQYTVEINLPNVFEDSTKWTKVQLYHYDKLDLDLIEADIFQVVCGLIPEIELADIGIREFQDMRSY